MKILNKVYWVFSFFAILILGWLAFDLSQSKSLIESEQMQEEAKIKFLNQKIALYEKKSKADDFFIKGEYDSALEIYNAIADSIEDNSFMEARFSTINTFKNLRNALDSTKSTGSYKIVELEQTMQRELDGLSSNHRNELDSTSNYYKGEIDNLKSNIASLERKVNDVPKLEKLTFFNRNGTRIVYYGQVKNGLANGFGVAHLSTNSFYEGEWMNNMKHGKGTYLWVDGHRYEGEYVNDKREGKGTYYWNTGDRYEGDWKDDKRNGFGVLYDSDNKVKLKGNWKDGEIVNTVN